MKNVMWIVLVSVVMVLGACKSSDKVVAVQPEANCCSVIGAQLDVNEAFVMNQHPPKKAKKVVKKIAKRPVAPVIKTEQPGQDVVAKANDAAKKAATNAKLAKEAAAKAEKLAQEAAAKAKKLAEEAAAKAKKEAEAAVARDTKALELSKKRLNAVAPLNGAVPPGGFVASVGQQSCCQSCLSNKPPIPPFGLVGTFRQK